MKIATADKLAFIIGNGKSRDGLDLRRLKGKGLIIGCNALYREYAPDYEIPDYLVSIDPGMIKEIKSSPFPKDRFIIPPDHEQFEPRECNPHQPRSNAGINAMIEAIRKGAEQVFLLGFDFMCQDEDKCITNVYANSDNYKGREITQAESISRLRFLMWLVKKAHKVEFVFIFPSGYKIYAPQSENVKLAVLEDFKKFFMSE